MDQDPSRAGQAQQGNVATNTYDISNGGHYGMFKLVENHSLSILHVLHML